MSHWNYRVLQSLDGEEFFIGEVYYADNGDLGWTDAHKALIWDNYDDLKGTAEMVQHAFEKPVLRIGKDDHLTEVPA